MWIYLHTYDIIPSLTVGKQKNGCKASEMVWSYIGDLRNYTTVINEVTYGNRVYLTRNGHGQCAIIDMKELDELDKQKALYTLMSKLNEAEVSIREEGTISAEDLEAELGV